ncbi:heat shock protein HslJ [Lewinella marina]|nr:META domain-containing protein [Neolewinella marina]NJB85581.1 heat shock protein HslJ [Neolewinella marina]
MQTALPLLAIFTTLLLGCAPQTPAAQAGEPAPDARQIQSTDWAGVYAGTVPAPNGGTAIETVLQIHPDTTYTLVTRPAGSPVEPQRFSGRFAWQPDGKGLKLLDIDSTDRPIYYAVGDGLLRQQDLVTVSIEGRSTNNYDLQKDSLGLAGQRWELSELDGTPLPRAKQNPYLTFFLTDQRVQGHAGCNSLSGNYRVESGELAFPPLVTTKMACPQLEVEKKFLEALHATTNHEVKDGQLILKDGSGKVRAVFKGQ